MRHLCVSRAEASKLSKLFQPAEPANDAGVRGRRRIAVIVAALAAVSLCAGNVFAARGNGRAGSVLTIGDGQSGFTGAIVAGDDFGGAVGILGDLDGDGVTDMVAGAPRDADGGADAGAVWVLFMNSDGTVKSHQKINALNGGFMGTLDPGDEFGTDVAAIGDLNADGTIELAVGAPRDDDGGTDVGAVWILSLATNGTVSSHVKISATSGGLVGIFPDAIRLGYSVAAIGDHDGDGNADIAVGAPWYPPRDGSETYWTGVVLVLTLNANGTVKTQTKIAEGIGGFTADLTNYDLFGISIASLGDLDGDGSRDLAVGAEHDTDGGPFTGAVYVLFLDDEGFVKSHQKISTLAGDFHGAIKKDQHWAHSLVNVGDVDDDGAVDILVGHYTATDEETGDDEGAAWMLFLRNDGTVKSFQKLNGARGDFDVDLSGVDSVGWGVGALGDLNGDGVLDWTIGTLESRFYVVLGSGAPTSLCPSAPLTGCAAPKGAKIHLRAHHIDDAKDRFSWSWSSSSATAQPLGDPSVDTQYALSVFDSEGGAPANSMCVFMDSGLPWVDHASLRYKYKDKEGTQAGVQKADAKESSNGRQSFKIRAKGARVPLPVTRGATFFDKDPNITVQLVNSAGGCWTADFTTATKATDGQFKARSSGP